jgi:hypothetical protein
MHVQIVNFQLSGIDDAGFRQMCDTLAPIFGSMPGLTAKYWLADPASNTYGGVYLWESPAAMAAYVNGDVWAMVKANPNLTNITSKDFDIIEGPTRISHGLIAAAVAA